ncbi:MAG: YggT family protein [Chloroflexales bacterium]|nr:YggT family protein [Chloroflexales bacterium]
MLGIISTIISVYQFVLFIRFIMQWIDKDGTNSINNALKPVTEPVLTPIRAKVTFNNIDFSALIVSILLSIISGLLTAFLY